MLPQELLNDEGLRILRKKRKLRKSQTVWVHSIVLSLPSKRNFSAKTVKNYSKGFVKVFCFNQMIFGFITLFRIFCLALQVCAYTRDSLVPMGTFNWTSSNTNLYFIATRREKCSNTEFFLVRIFLYSDQKKLRIWTLFTQCKSY